MGLRPIGAEREPELYDLGADPYGERNVASGHSGVVRELHEALIGWLREMDASEEAITVFE